MRSLNLAFSVKHKVFQARPGALHFPRVIAYAESRSLKIYLLFMLCYGYGNNNGGPKISYMLYRDRPQTDLLGAPLYRQPFPGVKTLISVNTVIGLMYVYVML